MQKLPSTGILQQNTTIQNNQRLWKPFQNQNATKNGNKRSTKNLQNTLKNSKITIYKHETKHAPNRIRHKRIKISKHRIQIIRYWIQLKKNIQRNKQ